MTVAGFHEPITSIKHEFYAECSRCKKSLPFTIVGGLVEGYKVIVAPCDSIERTYE